MAESEKEVKFKKVDKLHQLVALAKSDNKELVEENEQQWSKLTVLDDILEKVLVPVGDRPLCIFAICGICHQWKSLLIGYTVRRLEALERNEPLSDWMSWEDPHKPLLGFPTYFNAPDHDNSIDGISVWGRPFIIQKDEAGYGGEEVAVLLLDVQTNPDSNILVELALLCASETVFMLNNTFSSHSSQSQDLVCRLKAHIDFERYDMKLDGNCASRPNEVQRVFQTLDILIGNWKSSEEHPFGEGQHFLENQLNVKEKSGNPGSSKKDIKIRKYFTELNCFLLPPMGNEAVNNEDFNGSISQLDWEYANILENFLTDRLVANKLTAKKMFGVSITGSKFSEMIHKYTHLFNQQKNQIESSSVWQATIEMNNEFVLQRSLQIYKDVMEEHAFGVGYIPEDQLEELLSAAAKQACQCFTSEIKFENRDRVKELWTGLKEQLQEFSQQVTENNKLSMKEFMCTSLEKAEMEFAEKLRKLVAFPSEGQKAKESLVVVFYTEEKIQSDAASAMYQVMEEFQRRIPPGENENKVNDMLLRLQPAFERIVQTHLEKNSVQRLKAERYMEELTAKLVSAYKEQFLSKTRWKSQSMKVFRVIHSECQAIQEDAFRMDMQKPGNYEFQEEYRNRLVDEMESEFSKLEECCEKEDVDINKVI